MAKTRIYLDVDGVLNAIPAHKDIQALTEWSEHVGVRVRGYLITYAPELLRALEALPNDDVEIVWLTTWREMAVTDLSPAIGFAATDWRVVSDGQGAHGYTQTDAWGQGHYYWWKADALIADLIDSPVNKVVWIDDDAANYSDAVNAAKAKLPEIDFAVVVPNIRLGLTRALVNQIVEFIEDVDTAEDVVV